MAGPGSSRQQQPAIADAEAAQIEAQVMQQLAFLEAAVLREQKEILTEYGDPGLAASTLGEKLGGNTVFSWGDKGKEYDTSAEAEKNNPNKGLNLALNPWAKNLPTLQSKVAAPGPTVAAAGGNPFSTLKNLEHDYGRGVTGLNEAYNSSGNLFYSTARQDALGEFARDYQLKQHQAGQDVTSRLSSLNEQLTGARMAAQFDIADALQAAYKRKLQGVA